MTTPVFPLPESVQRALFGRTVEEEEIDDVEEDMEDGEQRPICIFCGRRTHWAVDCGLIDV